MSSWPPVFSSNDPIAEFSIESVNGCEDVGIESSYQMNLKNIEKRHLQHWAGGSWISICWRWQFSYGDFHGGVSDQGPDETHRLGCHLAISFCHVSNPVSDGMKNLSTVVRFQPSSEWLFATHSSMIYCSFDDTIVFAKTLPVFHSFGWRGLI